MNVVEKSSSTVILIEYSNDKHTYFFKKLVKEMKQHLKVGSQATRYAILKHKYIILLDIYYSILAYSDELRNNNIEIIVMSKRVNFNEYDINNNKIKKEINNIKAILKNKNINVEVSFEYSKLMKYL